MFSHYTSAMKVTVQTCMETKQDYREICSKDAGKQQRRKAHQTLEEQSTGKDDESTDKLPVCYQ